MISATVLIPTHDHGPLLYHSVASALAQTVFEIEVFIVGDGVNDATRGIVGQLSEEDSRVRFFDHPKGPRNGEIYRHAALAKARGEIVCYLADDDLWLPNHVEQMRSLLADANFAHAPHFLVDQQGILRASVTADLELAYYKEQMMAGMNYIPLSFGAHTLDSYRKLPYGWRTTPPDVPTDLYMWQQILSQPECRALRGARPTALNFPNPLRKDWPIERRLAELELWRARIEERDFLLSALDSCVRDHAAHVALLGEELASARAMLAVRAPEPPPDANWLTRVKAATCYAKGAAAVLFPELAALYRATRQKVGYGRLSR